MSSSIQCSTAWIDVAGDGRIIISEGPDPSQATRQMDVVINWFEDVKWRTQ